MKKLIALILAAVLVLSSVLCASALDRILTEVTVDNLLAVLDEYDPEDAFIIRTAVEGGENITFWWFDDEELLDAIDTCVHEEAHYCTGRGHEYRSELIYVGGKEIKVRMTEVFRTNEAALTIPEDYRTFRYDTYVGDPEPNMASDVLGPYGLLNEFAAYHRGMCVSMAMFDYCSDADADVDRLFSVVNDAANDRLAYSEFNYYILYYLDYAKKNHPDVYDEVMSNESFRIAYKAVQNSFARKIAMFESRLGDIAAELKEKGHRVSINGDFFYVDGLGRGIFTSDYKKMVGAAEEFADIAAELGAIAVPSAGEPLPEEPDIPDIPDEPDDPYEPYDPYDPDDPYEPYEPYDPDDPDDPYGPYDPYEPNDPDEPVGSDAPDEPDRPGEPETTKPSQTIPDDSGTRENEPTSQILYGDLDGNGKVTSADARSALRIAVDLDPATEAARRRADVDGKDGVTAADARLILRFAVALEKKFPVQR